MSTKGKHPIPPAHTRPHPGPESPRGAHPPEPHRDAPHHDDDHDHDRHRDHDRDHDHDRDRDWDRDHDHDHDRHRERCDDDRPTRIVERVWYFGDDDDCHRDPCDPGDGGGHGGQGGGGQGGGGHGGKWPGRPTRPGGTSTGRLGNGTPLTPVDIHSPNPPGVWSGTRAQMDLPYLFMRANAGDLGARPVAGPFWESPDIFILAGVDPALAPDLPPELGQVALAGQPNTLYAHVWNFGNASANAVLVEFYWVNPSLGINETTVNLVAQVMMPSGLGAKGSGKSHAVVKCPVPWVPTFMNGGHECLLVRVWDHLADVPGLPLFDARWNRHVAQRNIHVQAAGGTAMAMHKHIMGKTAKPMPLPHPLPLPAAGPALPQPIMINVGALYGAPATVAVERIAPSAVPWLQLHTGQRGVFPAPAPPSGTAGLSPPAAPGAGMPPAGSGMTQTVHHDNQVVAFATTDAAPAPGEAHVYRVTATQAGEVFGGYTIVLLG